MPVTENKVIVMFFLQHIPAIDYQKFLVFSEKLFVNTTGGFTTLSAEIIGQTNSPRRMYCPEECLGNRVAKNLF